jgi:signal transduction histidine kinase
MTSKRSKPNRPKRRAGSKPRTRRVAGSSREGVRQFQRERDAALEQQAATSEILSVISRSPGDVQPVLDTIVRAAVKLCNSYDAVILLRDGDRLRIAAHHGPIKIDFTHGPINRDWLSGRCVLDRVSVHVHDLAAAGEEFPLGRDISVRLKQRTVLAVPLLRDGEAIGSLTMRRQEVLPFSDKQIALLRTFSAQAVIAIENVRLFEAEQQRTRELSESLEQQSATSEVLRIVSTSPGELQPVFEAMLANAVRLCEAKFGMLFRYDRGVFHTAAALGLPPAYAEYLRGRPHVLSEHPHNPLTRVAMTKEVVLVPDITADQAYLERNPRIVALVELAGARTLVAVPMIKDSGLIGVLIIYRQEVRPFIEKQMALLTNFAAQAVIAIENTRLLNELRESLQQQTATADVLRVISRSTFDLQSVLNTLVQSATQLCRSDRAAIRLARDDLYYHVASHGFSLEHKARMEREPVKVDRSSIVGRVVLEGKSVHVIDAQADQSTELVSRSRSGNIRTLLGVPLQREGMPIGVLLLQRTVMRPFTDKEIGLAETFADQAVIAIENVRLFEAEQQRTRELSESLEQQTATAEVLQVINSSPGDLARVFDALIEKARALCDAPYGNMMIREGEQFRAIAVQAPAAFAEIVRRGFDPHPNSPLGRLKRGERVIHIADLAETARLVPDDPIPRAAIELGRVRTVLMVPLIKNEEWLGVFTLWRPEVRPFAGREIAVVQSFAAQAVIAIENARLLNELRESLQQQTATADVLKVISRSTFDLQSVLNTLAESAVRLCEADIASIHREHGTGYQTIAIHGAVPEQTSELVLRTVPFAAGQGSVLGRTVAERRVMQITDVLADPDYSLLDVQKKVGFRTIMGVPIIRLGNPIGVIVLMRLRVQRFSEKQIELATTFADQAGIAIENVRLFDEIQEKSRQLAEASQHKSQFLANMSHELRTPLNAILGYTELMADGSYGEPSEKMLGVLKRLEANGKHLLGLINDVLDLSKIEAGQLELELSDYSIQDIAQTVRSTLEPLATDKKLAFTMELASELPAGRGDGRRLTQVLINLVGNAIKFTDAGEVAIKAEANNGAFHVSVRDTGPGISAADQAKLFQEFQQADNAITKKKGGTGLGLAISKRIIEMHGGRIWVESQPGQGSTFTFTLPVTVERQVEAA